MSERTRTVFITGAASGIGLATAERFLSGGWNVAAFDRSGETLDQVLPDNPQIIRAAGNTTDRQRVFAAVEEAIGRFGPIDAVFANAGMHQTNTVLSVTDEQLDEIIAVNIKGTINAIQAAAPSMQGNGGGAIVINASDQSLIGKRTSFSYGMTKGALGQVTKSMALDLAEFGIRVNAVCPGTIRTNLGAEAFKKFIAANPDFDAQAAWQAECDLYPVKRIGEPSEVAGLVYFLCSEEAGFITGSLYSVDGGLTAQ
jgi:NAD(P)-dependent dehydrogenase (short-subunit alcohol dehydrogenase family)